MSGIVDGGGVVVGVGGVGPGGVGPGGVGVGGVGGVGWFGAGVSAVVKERTKNTTKEVKLRYMLHSQKW